jgi:hypothetical protein
MWPHSLTHRRSSLAGPGMVPGMVARLTLLLNGEHPRVANTSFGPMEQSIGFIGEPAGTLHCILLAGQRRPAFFGYDHIHP